MMYFSKMDYNTRAVVFDDIKEALFAMLSNTTKKFGGVKLSKPLIEGVAQEVFGHYQHMINPTEKSDRDLLIEALELGKKKYNFFFDTYQPELKRQYNDLQIKN